MKHHGFKHLAYNDCSLENYLRFNILFEDIILYKNAKMGNINYYYVINLILH